LTKDIYKNNLVLTSSYTFHQLSWGWSYA